MTLDEIQKLSLDIIKGWKRIIWATSTIHIFIEKKNHPRPLVTILFILQCVYKIKVWGTAWKYPQGGEGGEFLELGLELYLTGLLLGYNPGPIFRWAYFPFEMEVSPGKYTILFLRSLVKENPVVKQIIHLYRN